MTVKDLIDKLSAFPSHWRVLLPDDRMGGWVGLSVDEIQVEADSVKIYDVPGQPGVDTDVVVIS